MIARLPSHTAIPAHTRSTARRLRREMTQSERRFWHAVRAHRFRGLLFRRQVSIAGYVADFVCHQAKLIVEIDGGGHAFDQAAAADELRTKRLAAEGFRVIRFWNNEVTENLDGVLERLRVEVGDVSGTEP